MSATLTERVRAWVSEERAWARGVVVRSARHSPLSAPSLSSLPHSGIMGISEIIAKPGLINVDFADVRSVMASAGTALLGIGVGSGRSRASEAAMAAMSSPLPSPKTAA